MDDRAIEGLALTHRHAPPLRGCLREHYPSSSAHMAQFGPSRLHGGGPTCNLQAVQRMSIDFFVGRGLLHPDPVQRHLKLLGNEHWYGRERTLAHFDQSHHDGDAVVRRDADVRVQWHSVTRRRVAVAQRSGQGEREHKRAYSGTACRQKPAA